MKRSPSIFLRRLALVSVGDLIAKGFTALTVILLIRSLTEADYAFYVSAEAVAFLLTEVISNGLNIALVRTLSFQHSRHGAIDLRLPARLFLFEVAGVALIGVVAVTFPQPLAVLLLGKTEALHAVQWGVFYALALVSFQLGRAMFQAVENFRGFAFLLLLRQGGIFFLILVNIWLGYLTAPLLIGILIGVNILSALFGWVKIQAMGGAPATDLAWFWSFLRQSAWLIGYFVLLAVIARLDVLSVSRFASTLELAEYGTAVRYYSMGLLFLGSVHAVLLPRFARAEMQVPDVQRRFIRQWFLATSWVILPIVLFDVWGKSLFVGLNGGKYAEAFSIWIIFSVGIWFSLMFSPLVNILIGQQRYRTLFFLSSISLVIALIGYNLAVPRWGGMGAAGVAVFSQFVINFGAFTGLVWSKR